MEKLKKVWIFHPDASDPSLPGLQRPYKLGINIKELGYETTVFASSQLRYYNENLVHDNRLYEFVNGKVPFYYVKSHSFKKNDLNRVLNWITYYNNLKKLAKKLINEGNVPDIIVGSSPHPFGMLAAVKIGKKYNIPVVNEIRDFWPEVFFLSGRVNEKGLIGKLLLFGEKYIYKNSKSLIFLKEGDYNYIVDRKWNIENGGPINLKSCYYINNGVDIEEFNSNKVNYQLKDKDLLNDSFKAVYIGSLRSVNDIDKILDAAKLLLDNNILFLIYGDGEKKDELEIRVKDEMISNVKFKGRIPSEYIPFILDKASVNLLNYSQSKYNWSRGNSSNKLFEYMASGRPVISSVKMGYSIIEKYNCGIEIDNYNPERLADAIVKFKNMDNKEYNQVCVNSKNGALEFDYKTLSEKFLTVLEKTIGGK